MPSTVPPAPAKALGPEVPRQDEVLTPEALAFVAALHRRFTARRDELLALRAARRAEAARAGRLEQPAETAGVRAATWHVAPAPADLTDRRVEITGPTDRRMTVNALNSGARVWLADFEDATSPTWHNVVDGQINLMDAIRRRIDFRTPEGKAYTLGEHTATIVVRPRGWHLDERHLVVDGTPVPAAFADFGLYMFHNAAELLARGSGPYFYLPKMESHLEARLWNEVFVFAQHELGLERGTVRATVLIETVPAAFEMEEILYELREHASGLNAGRWDYLFSMIKTFRDAGPRFVLPDRNALTMAAPFMTAYARRLVDVCHRRGAHAIGGMAAFIPNRRDAAVNEAAFAKVRADKEREARLGFDGSWVAHPDLVPVCREVFDAALGDGDDQRHVVPGDVPEAAALLDLTGTGAQASAAGLRGNIDVGIRYLQAWLNGRGAAAIHNLMEDAATAEICRSQVWQWIDAKTVLSDGTTVTADLVREVLAEEVGKLRAEAGDAWERERWPAAVAVFEQVALGADYVDFLTLPAGALLD